MRRVIPLILVTSLAATGCGIANPYAHRAAQAPHRTRTSAKRPAPAAARGVTAIAALRRYTKLSIDWTSRTLAARQRQLARLAVDGARAQALQTAASYGAGSSLQRSRVANRGQLTSIAAGQGPRKGWWLITTQEQTSGNGTYSGQPAQAHIYAARLTQINHRWKVSTWSPQS